MNSVHGALQSTRLQNFVKRNIFYFQSTITTSQSRNDNSKQFAGFKFE